MMQLLLQTLLGAAGSIVAAVVGWLLTRQLRIIFAATERTEQHVQDSAESAKDAATASEGAAAAVAELTAALKATTSALDTVRENNDRLLGAILREEAHELRLRRIERFMADLETKQFRTRINAEGVNS